MLRVINEIVGYMLFAQDGEVGQCHDFLFDDRSWVVRYMVAKTATWLPGRKVIISPVFIGEPEWVDAVLPLRLSREQIEQSPPLDEHAPVSRQYEINYHQYYALPFYWLGQALSGTYPNPAGVIHPVPDKPVPEVDENEVAEGHLRSVKEVSGYHIAAVDGEVGHVEDFLVDDITWVLRYLVVDTRNWLPGRKVLISPQWIKSIHWVDEMVYLDLDTDAIKDSPEFDPSQPVNRQYEIELYDYYGRSHYWKP
jgi:hypothetical protein